MTAAVPIDTIVRAAIRGVREAQDAYESWSGGRWLWEAPEYLSTTYIARAIAEEAPLYITMEHGTEEAITDAGAKGRGKLHSRMRPNGRVDLLVWWADGRPRAPIEVKRHVSKLEGILTDIDRIEQMVHRRSAESSLQFGMMVFYSSVAARSSSEAEKKLEDRLKHMKNQLDIHLNSEKTRYSWVKSDTQVVDESAWAAIAIVIKPA